MGRGKEGAHRFDRGEDENDEIDILAGASEVGGLVKTRDDGVMSSDGGQRAPAKQQQKHI